MHLNFKTSIKSEALGGANRQKTKVTKLRNAANKKSPWRIKNTIFSAVGHNSHVSILPQETNDLLFVRFHAAHYCYVQMSKKKYMN